MVCSAYFLPISTKTHNITCTDISFCDECFRLSSIIKNRNSLIMKNKRRFIPTQYFNVSTANFTRLNGYNYYSLFKG